MVKPIETKKFGIFPKIHPPVFLTSATFMGILIIYSAAFTDQAAVVFDAVQDFIVKYFGWYYSLIVTLFVGFTGWLLFSRHANIKLGEPDDEPDFGYWQWFAMLFSAGMGIGLLFWSIAEPISHYMDPPYVEPKSLVAAQQAMRITYFHWGLHAWAIYIIVALSIAYFSFRHKLPLGIRAAFYPLVGDRIYGWLGDIIDIFAVFGTMFGVATSLGLGVIQVNSGLNFIIGIPKTETIQIILIAAITAVATLSVMMGLERGILRFSIINMWFGFCLLIFVFLIGPTLFLCETFVENMGRYLNSLVIMSFKTDPIRNSNWLGNWTVFYWGWWIAWSPFVGMFIARISRGRTIREFILGVLLVPSLLTFLWLNVFGGTALHFEYFDGANIVKLVSQDISVALYATLDLLPFPLITATLATIVVITFFITSSDSGSFVIDMITAGGHPDPPKSQRLFWAVTEGVIAAILLVVGGLEALQTAAISAGLPFSFVMIFMCYGLIRALRKDQPGKIGDVSPDCLQLRTTPG